MATAKRPETSIDSIDPNSGFSHETKTFHSLRRSAPLPPETQPLSLIQYTFSLIHSSFSTTPSTPNPSTTLLIDATTGRSLSYSSLLSQTYSLSRSLHSLHFLSRNDVALILSPPSLSIPVLYFSLLSLGITISPTNILASNSELTHQIQLSNPKVAFATSQTAPNLSLSVPTILLDSPQFLSFLTSHPNPTPFGELNVSQSDPAAILYSSGTTGRIQGVGLTHRNLIALISGFFHNTRETLSGTDQSKETHPVFFFAVLLFQVFGFFMLFKVVAMGETMVFMEKFDFEKMLAAVERYRVTEMVVWPPLVVAFVKSELTRKYDLSSLLLLATGAAPLGKELAERFTEKFPRIEIVQMENIHDVNGDSAGSVGDEKATAETLDSEGWLKTGDLCYFDSQGFLYVVDRLKELIKYKAYQVPPSELEQLLQSNPDIADAAVIPYPDEDAGQIPMAYVVRKSGSNVTETQITDAIAKQVAPYKKIRRVAFISSIPKTAAGKILRRELVNQALSSASSK